MQKEHNVPRAFSEAIENGGVGAEEEDVRGRAVVTKWFDDGVLGVHVRVLVPYPLVAGAGGQVVQI